MDQAQRSHIQWRPRAQDDLRAVIRQIAWGDPGLDSPGPGSGGLQGAGQAPPESGRTELVRLFGQALRSQIGKLAQCPRLGRTGRPGLQGDIRELVVHDDYIVFYRVLAQAGVVEILRIKHTARQAL